MAREPKVAVVWRGDREARETARPETSRLRAIFEALEAHGMSAQPCVYSEEWEDETRASLLGMDAALVWVDPISAGRRRHGLDALLRETATAGVLVSAHPDIIDKMGVKAVLHRTRSLGWGTDTHFHATAADEAAHLDVGLAIDALFTGRITPIARSGRAPCDLD